MYTPDQLLAHNCFRLNNGVPFFLYWFDGRGYRRLKIVGYKHGQHYYQTDYQHLPDTPGEFDKGVLVRQMKHPLTRYSIPNCSPVVPVGYEERKPGRFLPKV
jgi:hypothetical protein